MSTPCVLAVPHGDGWRGRYCHSDGYPTSKLPQLRALVARDGVEQVQRVLTEENYGWSALDLNKKRNAPLAGLGKRGHNVVGYGRAYTTADDQCSSDDWKDSEQPADEAWAYVIYPRFITVLSWAEGDTWSLIGTYSHAKDLTAEELIEIECGKQYERCNHLAWFHFPEAKGTNYSTAEWLSVDATPRLPAATAVLIGDTRVALGGSGGICFSDGTSAWRYGTEIGNRPIYWSVSTLKADGSYGGRDIVVGRRVKAGLKLKYPIVLPANGVRGEVVIPAGEVVSQ